MCSSIKHEDFFDFLTEADQQGTQRRTHQKVGCCSSEALLGADIERQQLSLHQVRFCTEENLLKHYGLSNEKLQQQ